MATTNMSGCDDEDGMDVEDCKLKAPLNVNFFTGQLLTVRDFKQFQNYFNEKRHLLNRVIHGSGIVCGLEVKDLEFTEEKCVCGPDNNLETITKWVADISAGVALDCLGKEIVISKSDRYVISEKDPRQLSEYFGLYIKRRDRLTNPVPSVHVTSCEDTCCYGNILEDFQLVFDNLVQSVQILFDSTTYAKSDDKTIYLIEPFEQVDTRAAILIIPSTSGEIRKDITLKLEKSLAGMNIFTSTLEQLELLDGSKITVEYKRADEEGEERPYTSSSYISGSPSGTTSEVVEKKRLCEDYYKVWLKECMCCDDPADAKVLLSVLKLNSVQENKIDILEEETTLFRSLVPNLKKLLDLISTKHLKSEPPSEDNISINSGIETFEHLKPFHFMTRKVDHKLNVPEDSLPPFIQVGIMNAENSVVEVFDGFMVNILTEKAYTRSPKPQDGAETPAISPILVQALQVNNNDFNLMVTNYNERGHPTDVKVAWYAVSSNKAPPAGEKVRVPNVIGDTFDVAAQELARDGLNAVRRGDPHQNAKVKTQTPSANTEVDIGSPVTLDMLGPVLVPDVIKDTFDVAAQKLARKGLNAVRRGDTGQNTKVKTQTPSANTEVDVGSPVRLEMGVEVPNVVGKRNRVAFQLIRGADLNPIGEGNPASTCVKQEPLGGTIVNRRSDVKLTFEGPF